MTEPKVIVDARSRTASRKLFSITLVERIVRQLDILRVSEVTVITDPDEHPQTLIRPDFLQHFKVQLNWISMSALHDGGCGEIFSPNVDVIVLDGDGIYDDRILETLLQSTKPLRIAFQSETDPLAIRVRSDAITDMKNLHTIPLDAISVAEMTTYVRFLRRSVVPVFRKVFSEDNLRHIENDLYERTFKGAMEFIATYGYKYPVREMTRWVAKTNITPNTITGAAVFCSFAAIPLLWIGMVIPGLLLAASFIVLDSLDGKLARLTFRLSHVADRVDHLTSLPTRMGWYSGLGWTLSGGQLSSLEGIGGLLLTVLPLLDKLNLNYCNHRLGRSLLDFRELDRRVHLFTVRRNDIFMLLVGSFAGLLPYAYGIAVIWMCLTWLWHSVRLAYLLNTSEDTNPK